MLEEIIFRNRNKDYGAWQLRKRYGRTLWLSLSISIVLIFLIFYIPLLLNLKKSYLDPVEVPPVAVEAELTEIHIEAPKEESLPEKKAEETPPKIEPKKEIPVKDTLAQEETIPDSTLAEEEIIEEPENPRLKEAGVFSCHDGIKDFRSWFLQRFSIPESTSYSQDIKIIIQFTVNKNGFIDEIHFQDEISPQLSANIEKILKDSPRWKPCIYEGSYIKQIYTLPVYILSSKSLTETGYFFKNLH